MSICVIHLGDLFLTSLKIAGFGPVNFWKWSDAIGKPHKNHGIFTKNEPFAPFDCGFSMVFPWFFQLKGNPKPMVFPISFALAHRFHQPGSDAPCGAEGRHS